MTLSQSDFTPPERTRRWFQEHKSAGWSRLNIWVSPEEKKLLDNLVEDGIANNMTNVVRNLIREKRCA